MIRPSQETSVKTPDLQFLRDCSVSIRRIEDSLNDIVFEVLWLDFDKWQVLTELLKAKARLY